MLKVNVFGVQVYIETNDYEIVDHDANTVGIVQREYHDVDFVTITAGDEFVMVTIDDEDFIADENTILLVCADGTVVKHLQ